MRAFLGIRGSKSVNSGIRNTIMKQPSMFFAYNNGIAATASGAELAQNEEGLYITRVSDLQIVNGGQTTASLSTSRRKDKIDLNDIFVQMKLSVVQPDYANEVIPRISRCANSQNKVSEADFFSNHPFHVRLEMHSRRIWAPAKTGTQHESHWFYERARGQYLNEQAKLTPSEKKRFLQQNPREQLLTKTDLAKYENAWRGLPDIVSFGAQKNFRRFAEWIEERWNTSESDFNEEYFRNSIAKAIIWKSTERLVSRQSWYQNGYRANIVAYTISKLAQLISSKTKDKYINLRNIWNQQRISPALEMQLSLISGEVFNVIIDPARIIENVTEWCKKKLCWEKVEQLDIPLIPEFSMELVDKDVLIHAARDAKAIQKIDNGIEAQSIVIFLGSSYWQNLFSWSKEKKILSPADESVIKVAAGIPNRIPTEKQSKWLLNLKARVEAEGFE
ncbi:MAG: AIPR family protein [Candidatus Xenobiia bacterium LiM19]